MKDKYLILLYFNDEKKGEVSKPTIKEIESFLELKSHEITKAILYDNEEPNFKLGQYIGFPDNMYYDDLQA